MTAPKFLYKPLYRPAAFSGIPKGWDFKEAPPDIAHKRPDLPMSRWRFGIIAYDRPLTADECKSHELEYVGETE